MEEIRDSGCIDIGIPTVKERKSERMHKKIKSRSARMPPCSFDRQISRLARDDLLLNLPCKVALVPQARA